MGDETIKALADKDQLIENLQTQVQYLQSHLRQEIIYKSLLEQILIKHNIEINAGANGQITTRIITPITETREFDPSRLHK